MTMDVREAFRVADEHVDDAELDALFTELLRVPSEHTELMEADPAVTGVHCGRGGAEARSPHRRGAMDRRHGQPALGVRRGNVGSGGRTAPSWATP